MSLEELEAKSMIAVRAEQSGDSVMVQKERWEQIQRLFRQERRSVSAIARELGIDRKTVRRCLRSATWQHINEPREKTRCWRTTRVFCASERPRCGIPLGFCTKSCVANAASAGATMW